MSRGDLCEDLSIPKQPEPPTAGYCPAKIR